jgi:hypothetical protein
MTDASSGKRIVNNFKGFGFFPDTTISPGFKSKKVCYTIHHLPKYDGGETS